MTNTAAFAHPRYHLQTQLGTGNMGTVFRAHDRLTGQAIALKRVQLDANDADELRLGLAHEFRTLAGLRHPHIISVLDYGFDAVRWPFFTMELLSDARPLLDAARTLPRAQQLDLLLQALEALAYLHRRGVLHHDLKPENILVVEGRVCLLDFGLAVLVNQHRSDDAFGTFQYLAPEVIDGQTYTEQADIYSLGVIAYELLLGHPPIEATTVRAFLHELRTTPPDLIELADTPGLAQVFSQLLAKTPAERPTSARAAIEALRQALGLPAQHTDAAIRESYLQAATFVGREQELAVLTTALDSASQGHGSAWLIGGESGVGKSRLLDELRTQALVAGFQVVRGQALSESGAPAQLWREILAWLAVTTPLSNLAASVLKPFVPQIAELVGRPVADAPVLASNASQDRFCAVVLDSVRQATAQQPLVLIFEDLHWAEPLSRAILTCVMRALAPLRLVVLATYRNDEQPSLPSELPEAHTLTLAHLGTDQVAQLTSAIVGVPAAQLSRFSQLMYEQTEGNALYVVEILRSLAAKAGLFSQVHQVTLPEHLLVGGMQAVIQRRLQRIAPHDYPWLEVAALAGRELDLALLYHLDNTFDWPGWLNRCAEEAVLEPQGTGWRFAHDQLRQGAVLGMARARAQTLHAHIAVGLEQIYADNLTPHLGHLVYHYMQTEQVDKQRWYLAEAAHAAEVAYDSADAVRYYDQLLPLLTAEAQSAVYLKRGAVLELLGQWDAAESDYLTALMLTREDGAAQAHAQLALGKLCESRGDYDPALAWLAQARANWAAQHNPLGVSQALIQMGTIFKHKGEYPDAQRHLEEGLTLVRAQHNQAGEAAALSALGSVAYAQGNYTVAQALVEASLALQRKLGNKLGISGLLNNLGSITSGQGDYTTARALYEESLALHREMGHKHGIVQSIFFMATVTLLQGNYAVSQALHAEGLVLARELGDKQGTAWALCSMGSLALQQGDYTMAQARFEESLTLARKLGDKWRITIVLFNLGEGALAQHNLVDAYRAYAESLILAQEIGFKQGLVYNFIGLAAIKLNTGQAINAARLEAVSEVLRRAITMTREPAEQAHYESVVATTQAQLGEEVFAAAWAEGKQLTMDEAVQLALQESPVQL